MSNNNKTIYRKDYQPSEFLIRNIYLNVLLEEDVTTVIATVTFLANPNHPPKTNELILDGEELKLVSVKLNGKAFDTFEKLEGGLKLTGVPTEGEFTTEITTQMRPQENKSLEGLYKSSGNYCTQCEAQGFRKITYYLDRPDVMTSFTTRIEGDKAKYPVLLSSGNQIERGDLDKGRHFAIWHDPHKKPCYLFALVAGDLEFNESIFKTMSGREVVIRIFVEKGNVPRTAHAMNAVKKAMRWDEEHYGREYDLDIFMIVAVSDFNMGAMENKGLNIFNDKYILADSKTATDTDYELIDVVVAHEYFHNWTGNRVTCREWFNLCLKEGLTVFRDQSFTEDMTHKNLARIKQVQTLRMRQFPEDAGGLAHSVRPDSYIEINNFYTATVYEKGAEIFRMLKLLLGDEGFRKGTDLYFDRFDGQAVTIDDIMDVMEEANNFDLSQFRLWYAQAGTPLVKVTSEYNGNEQVFTLHCEQVIPDTPEQMNKKPMLIPLKVALYDQKGDELKASQILKLVESKQSFEISHVPENPVLSILQGFSAPVKLEYDHSLAELIHLMKHDQDDFNHWEAGQNATIKVLLDMIENGSDVPTEYLAALKHCLNDGSRHGGILSLSLKLPDEKYIGSFMQAFDIDAVAKARTKIVSAIAKELKDDFLKVYQANQLSGEYDFTPADTAKRALRNTCLYYLAHAGEHDLVFEHYKNADNMTDMFGALSAINDVECQQRQDLLAAFYETFKDNHLVVNKWFQLQALSRRENTFFDVKALSEHEAFEIKNPNKVYSLLYAFGAMNTLHFNRADGAAYDFYAEKVMDIDRFNPQVASRLAREFSVWRQFDEQRQVHAKAVMKKILDKFDISKDLFEVVTKIQ